MQKNTYKSDLKSSSAMIVIALSFSLSLSACGDNPNSRSAADPFITTTAPPPQPPPPPPPPNGTILVGNFNEGSIIAVDPVTGQRSIVSQNPSDTSSGVGGGPNFLSVSDIQVSADGQSLIAVDLGTDTILDVNVITGRRLALSSGIFAGTGDGSEFGSPHGIEIVDGQIFIADFGVPGIIALDDNGDASQFSTSPVDGFIGIRAFDILADGDIIAADFGGDRLFTVDAVDGVRTLLTGPSGLGVVRGEGPLLAGPVAAIELDANTIISSQFQNPPAMFMIDRTTGDRTLLTGELLEEDGSQSRGTGPVIAARALVLNPADSNIIYATSFTEEGVFEIDISTGNRRIISTALTTGSTPIPIGSGPGTAAPLGLTVDADGSILISDLSTGGGSIFRVDPATGDRTLISEEVNTAQGTDPFGPFGVGLVNGEIFAADGNGLFQVDAVTGNRTLIGELGLGALFGVHERDATSVFVSNFGAVQGIEIVDLTDGTRTTLSNATNP